MDSEKLIWQKEKNTGGLSAKIPHGRASPDPILPLDRRTYLQESQVTVVLPVTAGSTCVQLLLSVVMWQQTLWLLLVLSCDASVSLGRWMWTLIRSCQIGGGASLSLPVRLFERFSFSCRSAADTPGPLCHRVKDGEVTSYNVSVFSYKTKV